MLHCPQCDGRVCAQPIVLAAIYFFYVWDVVLFGYLAYLDSLWYLLVMLVGWLILDYFTVYVPFSPLRSRAAKNDPRSVDTDIDAKTETQLVDDSSKDS